MTFLIVNNFQNKRNYLLSKSYYELSQAYSRKLENYISYDPKDGIINYLNNLNFTFYESSIKNHLFSAEGFFDHSKEIHVPKVFRGEEGYDVITPFYYFNYDNDKIVINHLEDDPNEIKNFDQGKNYLCIAVNRGWIPALLKDRRTRPYDVNSGNLNVVGKLVYTGHNNHDYKVQNVANLDVFNNLSLNDFFQYWGNKDPNSTKSVYLQSIETSINNDDSKDIVPIKPTIKESIIEDVNKEYSDLRMLKYTTSSFSMIMLFLGFITC